MLSSGTPPFLFPLSLHFHPLVFYLRPPSVRPECVSLCSCICLCDLESFFNADIPETTWVRGIGKPEDTHMQSEQCVNAELMMDNKKYANGPAGGRE